MENTNLGIMSKTTTDIAAMRELYQISGTLFKSGLFPNAKTPEGVFVIIQYGHELGISPVTALQTFSIIKGKICLAGQVMLTLARRAGVTYKILKETDEECEIHFKNGQLEYISRFTIEQAERMRLIREDSGWVKTPQDMLFWRAVTRGLRRVCPEVIAGVVAIEELEPEPIEETKADIALEEPKAESKRGRPRKKKLDELTEKLINQPEQLQEQIQDNSRKETVACSKCGTLITDRTWQTKTEGDSVWFLCQECANSSELEITTPATQNSGQEEE